MWNEIALHWLASTCESCDLNPGLPHPRRCRVLHGKSPRVARVTWRLLLLVTAALLSMAVAPTCPFNFTLSACHPAGRDPAHA